jgi:hypothetical protein
MPHPKDKWVAATLPNGWVMLEVGEKIPQERMFHHRGIGAWEFTTSSPSRDPYDPYQHRALARRVAPSEREW